MSRRMLIQHPRFCSVGNPINKRQFSGKHPEDRSTRSFRAAERRALNRRVEPWRDHFAGIGAQHVGKRLRGISGGFLSPLVVSRYGDSSVPRKCSMPCSVGLGYPPTAHPEFDPIRAGPPGSRRIGHLMSAHKKSHRVGQELDDSRLAQGE